MRCPACGGRNADSADWCSLCFTPLRTSPPVEEPPLGGPDVPVEEQTAPVGGPGRPVTDTTAPDTTAPDTPPSDTTAPTTSRDGRFRRTDEGLDWRCAACETWNPIERQTCVTCREPFTRTLAPVADEPRREVDETTAVGATILLPGTGHVLLGQGAAGALRIILYVIWLLGGLVLLRAAAGSGQPILPAVPLLLGALVVLVASVVEVQRTVSGDDTVLLTPRVTLWLVVAVLGGLMVSFLAATMAVRP